jgi:4-hydroxybenzoate polyprenyltransferase/geranylgeranylglycerol-phosphate geranylgeranyltransferase
MNHYSIRHKAMAHLEMTRPYTIFYPGLLSVAGFGLVSRIDDHPGRTVLTGVVTVCGWVAGLYAGDYFDRDIDARAKPFRPIPSGRVSRREAFGAMLGLVAAGYGGALVLGWTSLLLAVVTTILGISYSKAFKSRALLGNFDRGVLGACAVAFGGLAGGRWGSPDVALLAAIAFFHDSATNLVGALRDVDGDRESGCLTVPVVHGVRRATAIACVLALAALVATAALVARLPFRTVPALLLVVTSAVVAGKVYGSLWIARRTLTRPRALAAHKDLVVERLLLVGGIIGARASASVTATVVLAALMLTIGLQRLLRDRYELHPAATS